MARKLTVFIYLNPFRSLTGDRSEFEVMSYFYHKYEPVIFIACIETKVSRHITITRVLLWSFDTVFIESGRLAVSLGLTSRYFLSLSVITFSLCKHLSHFIRKKNCRTLRPSRRKLSHFVTTLVALCNKPCIDGRGVSGPIDSCHSC